GLLGRPSREAGLNVVILTMAVACGLTAANLYYPQPLLALVSRGFGVSQGTAAIVVTVTQLGYAAGLAFLVPLGDMLENRKLACRTLLVTAAALAVAAFTPDFTLFLVVSVFIGVTSVVVQILVPFAAHLAPPAQRGKYVGRVMSGLLLGILLARSVASVTAAAWGWRSIYIISAVAMLALSAVLWRVLPVRRPEPGVRYGGLLRSALRLVATEPVLRRRSASQALMFGAFSAFWTSIAYELIDAHHLSQLQIALFALVGAAGAVAAVVAGALGDRGYGRAGRGLTTVLAAAALVLAGLGQGSVILLACAAVLLDLAAQSHQVLSQRDIYALREDARARINTVYMTSAFVGGSVASGLSGWLHDVYGWNGVTVFGAILPVLAGGIWIYDRLRPPARPLAPSRPPSPGPCRLRRMLSPGLLRTAPVRPSPRAGWRRAGWRRASSRRASSRRASSRRASSRRASSRRASSRRAGPRAGIWTTSGYADAPSQRAPGRRLT
ncbi:MAG: MFS transporter, partial [Streptosporangiaceae bacterium]